MQELLRMVPGGEAFDVLKMPYNWKKNPEKIREYPIIISRTGGLLAKHFRLMRPDSTPITPDQYAEGIEAIAKHLAVRLERDQPEVYIHINGHYSQHVSSAQGEALLSSAPIFTAYQQQNADPRVTTIDTITPTHAVFPLGIRSDRMHASSFANYIEGQAIVADLCARDGIPLPNAIIEHVDTIIAEAADQRDAFHVLSPQPAEPSVTYNFGDTIDVAWEVVDPTVTSIYVLLHRVGHNDYYLTDRIDVTEQKTGQLQWTVQEPMPTLGNRVSRVAAFTPETAETEYFARKIPGGWRIPSHRQRRRPAHLHLWSRIYRSTAEAEKTLKVAMQQGRNGG